MMSSLLNSFLIMNVTRFHRHYSGPPNSIVLYFIEINYAVERLGMRNFLAVVAAKHCRVFFMAIFRDILDGSL